MQNYSLASSVFYCIWGKFLSFQMGFRSRWRLKPIYTEHFSSSGPLKCPKMANYVLGPKCLGFRKSQTFAVYLPPWVKFIMSVNTKTVTRMLTQMLESDVISSAHQIQGYPKVNSGRLIQFPKPISDFQNSWSTWCMTGRQFLNPLKKYLFFSQFSDFSALIRNFLRNKRVRGLTDRACDG